MTIKEHAFDMTNFRNFAALCATAAFLAVGLGAHAQDDLDDLLADLESDTEVESPKGDAPAEATEEAESAAAEEPAEVTEEAEEVAEEAAPAEKGEETASEDAAVEEGEAEVEEAEAEDEEDEAEASAEAAPVAESAAAPAAAAPVALAAESVSEKPAEEASNEEVDEVLDLLLELASESGEEPGAAVPVSATMNAVAVKAKSASAGPRSAEDAEILEYIRSTEKLRREAMDLEAMREINAARASMTGGEYLEAVKHYGIAVKLLNDRPSSKALKRECNSGMANGLYLAALEEESTGRRERAIKLIEKAIERRHPKARRQLEAWLTAEDPDKNKTDVSEITHRRNEQRYKERRAQDRQHLKRAKQHLAQDEFDKALDECELVLVSAPYDKEAIRLRGIIERKRLATLKKEHQSTRDGMIADVEEAWRPVYAVDARELETIQKGQTVKKPTEAGTEQTIEQTIIKRMKEMKLPTISFKPPATIGDAVEYFRGASKDFDRPEIPLEQRGFNFILKTPEPIVAAAAEAEVEGEDGFGDSGDDEGAAASGSGLPVIQMISASDITLYDALKLVCESVGWKFTVQGPFVMVMPKDMSTEELVTRSFPVLSTFLEKMGSASEDMTTMRDSGAFGSSSHRKDEDDNGGQEKDWKQFFSLLGVNWPEGSSIFYVKTVGRLFVKNTQDNLAEFENVLLSLNQQVTLVEIETRFVEVCQDDLNSLGFEWILNNDCAVNVNDKVAKALGLRDGNWPKSGNNSSTKTTTTINYKDAAGITYGSEEHITTVETAGGSTVSGTGNPWLSDPGSGKQLGINGFGGTSSYSNGNRYLSSMDNPISGNGYSKNDQFMRANVFLGGADLSMILHMLSQRSDTDLLSAPKVLTRPGEEAVMKVVTEYIYPTDYDVTLSSSGSSSGGSYGSSNSSGSSPIAIVEPQSFTMREVGVILQVTPTLTDDGNVVDLELNTQVVDEPTWRNYGMKIPYSGNTSLQNFQGIGEIFTGLSSIFTTLGEAIPAAMKATLAENATTAAEGALNNLTQDDGLTYYDVPMEQPFFHVRSIDSKVSVYPGATIVMGGLITEARKAIDDKVPFLGDIPYIGRLFRSHAEETSKRNLLIFVTTRIVDGRGREMHNDGFDLADQTEVKAAPDASGK